MPALRCTHDRAPALGRAALPSLRVCRACTASVPVVRQGGFAPGRRGHRARRRAPGDSVSGLSRAARRPRQHVAQGRHEPVVHNDPARSAVHSGRHANARQGPSLSPGHAGIDSGRRRRAVFRRLPRQRAHGTTDRAGGRPCRARRRAWQGDHPDPPGRPSTADPADRARLFRLCRTGLERAPFRGSATVFTPRTAAR